MTELIITVNRSGDCLRVMFNADKLDLDALIASEYIQ